MFQIKDKNKKLYTTLSSFLCVCVCLCVRGPGKCCGVGAGQSRPVFDTMKQQQQPVRRHQGESSPVGLGSQPASQSGPTGAGQQFVFPTYTLTFFFFPLWFFLTHISRRHNFGNCVKCVKRRAAAGKTCHLLFL